MQHVLADSFGADVLLRASTRVQSLSPQDRIKSLLAVRHNLPQRASAVERQIFQEWNQRASWCRNANQCDEQFGMERLKMLYRAFPDGGPFELLRFPFVLPPLDAPAEQERFIEQVKRDLEASATADEHVLIAPFYERVVCEFKTKHDVSTYPRLLTIALETRLEPAALSPLAHDNSTACPYLYDKTGVLHWPTA